MHSPLPFDNSYWLCTILAELNTQRPPAEELVVNDATNLDLSWCFHSMTLVTGLTYIYHCHTARYHHRSSRCGDPAETTTREVSTSRKQILQIDLYLQSKILPSSTQNDSPDDDTERRPRIVLLLLPIGIGIGIICIVLGDKRFGEAAQRSRGYRTGEELRAVAHDET